MLVPRRQGLGRNPAGTITAQTVHNESTTERQFRGGLVRDDPQHKRCRIIGVTLLHARAPRRENEKASHAQGGTHL